MSSTDLVKTSLKLPSDLLSEITRASEKWALQNKLPPHGKRNMWIIKTLRVACEKMNSLGESESCVIKNQRNEFGQEQG